jgi:addiction module HigA family antidote
VTDLDLVFRAAATRGNATASVAFEMQPRCPTGQPCNKCGHDEKENAMCDKIGGMAKRRIPPVHPGEFLAEILDELGLSQAEFARRTGVPPTRVSHVMKGTRPVTAELALRFGRAFGQTPQYWISLQNLYDLEVARAATAAKALLAAKPARPRRV